MSIVPGAQQPPLAKLPLKAAVVAAYRHFASHLALFEIAAWPWLAVMALWKGLAIGFGVPQHLPAVNNLVETVIGWLASAAVAVVWHRAILLGEAARGAPRVGRHELRYLGVTIMITFIACLPLVPLVATITASPAQSPASQLVAAAGMVLTLVVWILIARFYLALPAVAIGAPIDLMASWRKTAGNTWRLVGGMIGCVLPLGVILTACEAVLETGLRTSDLARALADLVATGFGLAIAALCAGFLSFSYLWFDGRKAD
jgi:hypothetical protein